MTHSDDAVLQVAQEWRRERWLALADDLLASTSRFASPTGSLIRLPGPVSASGAWSDGLEGFARTFLLAAFRLRGESGMDPAGLLERYADGLRSGTDPASPERWPRLTERRQAIPEAASIAIGLSETRPWLWDQLDERTRERTVDWLAGVVGTTGYSSNWIWFQNVIEAFLQEVGGPWSQADLDRNEEMQERLYVGDGWYSDGFGHNGTRQSFDYYAGWAWHLYPAFCARIHGEPLAPTHVDRLRAYLEQAQYLVGTTGAPLFQGRSLIYRFAVLAPFWIGALTEATPLAPGQTRVLTGAMADYFVRAGAIDERGLLPLGWHGRFDRMRQLYSGGSSPFWASKAFLGLLLAPDDPVWTVDPQLPYAWRSDRVQLLKGPGWLISSTIGDGIVRIANHGSDHAKGTPFEPHADDPFYQRLGYSNVTSPQLTPTAIVNPLESNATLLDLTGSAAHRGPIRRLHQEGRVAVSRSRTHWLDLPGGRDSDAGSWSSMRYGPFVTTGSVLHGPHEVRFAWWNSAPPVPDGPPRPGTDIDDGVAWPCDSAPWTAHLGGWTLAASNESDLTIESGPGWVRVIRAEGLVSSVREIANLDTSGATGRSGADPFGDESITPWLRSSVPVEAGQLWAAQLTLTGQGPIAEPELTATVHRDGADRVEVRWSDGQTDGFPCIDSL